MNEKSAMLQLSMRRNAEELHQVVSELSNWEQAIATQDAQLRGAAPPAAVVAPDEDEEDEEEAIAEAAANRAAARALASSAPAAAPSPRPNRLDAYASWDQYDAEAEASALDQAAAREERKAAKQRKKEAALLAAKRAASEQQAASLRAAGNEAFGRAQYEQASLLYTEALVLHPRSAAAYANRALALLKLGKWAEAEEDCTAALLLDRAHVKALLRRADARCRLRDWEGSHADYEAVLALEPNNAAAKRSLTAVAAAAKEARARRRARPEVRRVAAAVRCVEHDVRNDADSFVSALLATPLPAAAAAGGQAASPGRAEHAAIISGSDAAGAPPPAEMGAAAAAGARARAAAAAAAAAGGVAVPATTAALERSLAAMSHAKHSGKAAAYLQALPPAELVRLFKPGLGPDACAVVVSTLAALERTATAEPQAAPAAQADGAAEPEQPGAPAEARACALRLLVALSSMGRRDLALAFLDGPQRATLLSAIALARAGGPGAAEEAALASLASALAGSG